jgi:hypothetical protein
MLAPPASFLATRRGKLLLPLLRGPISPRPRQPTLPGREPPAEVL